jgi:hypothetical protein
MERPVRRLPLVRARDRTDAEGVCEKFMREFVLAMRLASVRCRTQCHHCSVAFGALRLSVLGTRMLDAQRVNHIGVA